MAGVTQIGTTRIWIGPLVGAVLFFGAATAIPAQSSQTRFLPAQSSAPGSLTGKLTDLHFHPLAGVGVILRNESTGAEFRTTTAKNGTYRFTGLQAGEYTMEADSPRLGRGGLEGIVIYAGRKARVQVAMSFKPPASIAPVPVPLQAAGKPAPQPLRSLAPPSPTVVAMLPSEPPRVPPLPSESTPGPASVLAVTPAPVENATVAPEPLQRLSLTGLQRQIPAKLPERAGQLSLALPGSAAQQPSPVTPAVATTVAAAELQALPVSGQRWEEFVQNSPTAVVPAGSSQTALRGAGQEQAETTIDGANTRLAFGSATRSPSAIPEQRGAGQNEMGQAWKGGRGFAIGESAIRQVQMVAGNVETKGMYAAGGLTDVETESGRNPLHGQGFFFDRQNNWGARNPFTHWTQNTGSATAPVFTSEPYTPPDHETSWGIGLGSHILRDKLFWFAAFDSSQRNDPGLAMVREPMGTDEAPGTTEYGDCVGFFCPPSLPQVDLLCAQLGLSIPSELGLPSSCPVAEATQKYSQMLEDLDGLLGPAPRTSAQQTGFGRIDWKASERNTFTFEGIGAHLNAPGGGFTRISEDYGSHSFGSSQASEQWLLARWETFLTPNLLAVSQFSAGREILSARPDTPSSFEKQFLLQGETQLPGIVVDSSHGFTIGNPSRFGQGSYPDEHLYDTQEMLDWVHGSLLVNAGFEIDHNYDATSLLRNGSGTYHYSRVANFISDAQVFVTPGLGPSTPQNPHNCGVTDTTFGALPCYSYFSQMIGPTTWHLSTNDWAGYVSARWDPSKIAVFSLGLRWEREQMPPPIAALANPDLPLAGTMPDLGNNWAPRVGLAIGPRRGHWPVLRLGYGMYYARTENATLETALTQTGSLKGDLSFFIRPTDGYTSINGTSAAPFFPNELEGPPGRVVTPGVVEFAPRFRNPEVHQAVASVEERLPGRVQLTASALVSLGRRLPVYIDTNITPVTSSQTITYNVCDEVPTAAASATPTGGPPTANTQCGHLGLGPITTATITVPFYAQWPAALLPGGVCPNGGPANIAGQCGWLNPNYQEIDQITSKANSTYEAFLLKLTRYGGHGLSFNAYYTYAHAMDWNPGESPMDPADFGAEYGTSDLDVRNSLTAMVVYEAPWKLHDLAGRIANGWMLSGIGRLHSGLPYTMRVTGSLPEEFDSTTGAVIQGLGPGMNGSGGDSRVYGVGRNTYRYPFTWRADLRIGKSFDLGRMRRLELLAESFNLFNHQNVTDIETTGYEIDPGTPPGGSSTSGASATPPSLIFLTGLKTSSTTGLPISAFGQPLQINGANFYPERQIELGLRMTF